MTGKERNRKHDAGRIGQKQKQAAKTRKEITKGKKEKK